MFSIRISLYLVCLVILCNLGVYETRKVSGGGRRTTWSRPSSTSIAKPKPQPTFSHSDITKFSYGHNEPSAARRPASPPKSTHTNTNSHKPSAPPAEHAHNTYQQNAPRPNPNPNPNPNNPNPNNIGWNVPQNNPGGSGTNNIGWNTNNQQHTQQRVNTANAPPPYPGAPHPQGPPPPYPGNPSHGQNIGAPPPYPGYPSHGQNFGAPPAYPGYPSHGQNVGPPPAYPGLNTGYHGTNYNPNQARYPQQPGYGGVGGYQGYPQQYPGGYGGAPGGFGGYGGGGFGGLGGFGGGGFGGGGYGGYGNGMFAPKKSGISGTTLIGGALLGLTLYSLAKDRNHYHYYYPNSQPVYSNGQPGQGNVQGAPNMPNGEHSFNGDQGAYTSYIGNLSCISIYNAREVSLWANNTLQEFYRQYPTQAFPVSVNGSNDSMNFTVIPGEIIHNESLAVTCCGTDKGSIDVLMITNGKSRDVNCVYQTYTMPFRRLTFIPINNTANSTNSTPVAAPLTSTSTGNISTTMAGITSQNIAEITSTTSSTNSTTTAPATTQEVNAETTNPTAPTKVAEETAVQNLTSSVNVTEIPTTIPSVEITTIKN